MTDLAHDQLEHFLAEAISSSPKPLKDLAEFLSGVLCEDHWKTADRLLLALAIGGNASTSTAGIAPSGDEPNPNPHEAERRIALEAALTALVEAKALKEVRSTVAGWNGEGREEGPFDRHPPRLGASIATNCGAVYALDEALTKARALLTTKTGE